jgi:DNA-directed RNA polymerase beta subunit
MIKKEESNLSVADTTMRQELVGMENLLSPFTQFNSSQRADMFSSNIAQALVIDGCEPPRIGSGYEQMFGDFSFNTTERKSDAQLLDVIPKFEVGFGSSHISECPSKTVILLTEEGVDCIEIRNHEQLDAGFGYKNKISPNVMYLNAESGAFLDKDTKFSTPSNHKDGLYCLGTNANIVYMTIPHVVQDAIVISKSFADKCDHLGLHTVKIILNEDDLPVNLYGNEIDPKIFPDIGQQVNEEGVLMAIRESSSDAFSDLIESSINHIQLTTDRIIKAPVGSTVVDVQTFCSPIAFKKLFNSPGMMAQLIKYQQQHYNYYRKVIDCYNKVKRKGYKLTPRFNDLVTKAMCLKKPVSSKEKLPLIDNKSIINYFVVEVTYAYVRKVDKGFKFAGRSGDKGVVSDIWDDENMPIDAQGIRADVIISPESVVNRLNPSQLYEQFYNRMCVLMTERIRKNEFGNLNNTYNTVIKFLASIREEYAREINLMCNTKEEKQNLIDDIKEDGFYLICPPFCKDINISKCKKLASEFNYVESPVTYSYRLRDGSLKTITTKYPQCIGSKYMYLLGKIPRKQASALEVSYINQFGLPIKAKSKELKLQHLYTATPLRFGEDEVSMLIMDLPAETVARFLGIRASSKQATDTLIKELLTDKKPSALSHIKMSTDDIINNSIVAKIFNHYMGLGGYDTSITSIGRK